MALESTRWLEPNMKARRMSTAEEVEDSPTGTEISCANVKSSPTSVESGPNRRPYVKMDYEFSSDDIESENNTGLVTSELTIQPSGSSKKRLLDNPSPTAKTPHTEEKRVRKFVCRYCNKAFSLMNVLKVHERIHTGEKPYICEICDKAFNQSGSLNRHKNTHMKRSCNNRSYSCRFCPRQFLHSSQLQEHESVEHGAVCKTGSPHLPEQTNPGMYEGKALSTSIADLVLSGSSPTHTHASPNGSSAQSSEDAVTTPKLTSSFNLFGKTEANLLSFPPIPVGLNIFAPSGVRPIPGVTSGSYKLSTNTGSVAATGTSKRSNDPLQCDLCQQTFVSRMDLDKHCGQHLLQQMGLSLGSVPVDARIPNPLPTFGQSMSQALRMNAPAVPIEDILLSMIQNPVKLNTPQSSEPVGAGSSSCTDNPQQETLHSLTAALFPGAAAAATLAALSQLILPNTSDNANSLHNSAYTLPSTLTATSEMHPDTKYFSPKLTQPSPANASPNPFTQLLRSITVTNSSPAPVAADLYPSSHTTSTGARSRVEHEHGLNLAVSDKAETARPDQPISATTQLSQTQSTKIPLYPQRPDISALPWLVSQDLLVKSLSLAGLSNLSSRTVPTMSDFTTNVIPTQFLNKSSLAPRQSVQTADRQAMNKCSVAEKTVLDPCTSCGDLMFTDTEASSTSRPLNFAELNTSEADKPSMSSPDNSQVYFGAIERQYKNSDERFRNWKRNATQLSTAAQACVSESGKRNSPSTPITASCSEHITNGPIRTLVGEITGNLPDLRVTATSAADPLEGHFVNSSEMCNFPGEKLKRNSVDHASQWSPLKLSQEGDTYGPQITEDRSTGSKTANSSAACADHWESNVFPNQAEDSFIQSRESEALLSLLKHFQSQNVLWACSACQIYFLDKVLWQMHESQMHSHTGRFICAMCKEDQKNSRRFLAHFLQMHRPTSSDHHTSSMTGHSNKGSGNRLNDLLHEVKSPLSSACGETLDEPVNASSMKISGTCTKRCQDVDRNTNGSRNGHRNDKNNNQSGTRENETPGVPYQKRVEMEIVSRLCGFSTHEEEPEALKETDGVITQR